MLLVDGPNLHTTNLRWRLEKKLINRYVSATVQPIATKFGVVMHTVP